MSLKKFQPEDILLNTMKAHPSCEFFIFDGNVYYNNRPHRSGSFTGSIVAPEGFISLYEYNVDRRYHAVSRSGNPLGAAGDPATTGTPYTDYPILDKSIIYPYITKQGTTDCWSTVSSTDYYNTFEYGDILTSTYPMTASITREYMAPAGKRIESWDCKGPDDYTCSEYEAAGNDPATSPCEEIGNTVDSPAPPKYPHYFALRNRLNHYRFRSPEYAVTGAITGTTYEWIKDEQTMTLISIPSIFYGSRIQPGSLSLKWYFTGSLIGELQDIKRNGELIQVNSSSALTEHGGDYSGSVAGVALYDEGFILLTGSWALNEEQIALVAGSSTGIYPRWIYFGAGANDGVSQGTTATNFYSASFNLSFRGQTNTQVLTMFAHAKKGKANFSNNPTYLKYGQDELRVTSSMIYEENPNRLIANTVSSSYSDYSASFKREVYISKVAIYDESKNLIGVTTLSNPVLKEEDQDLTFKLRLDI
jgi:hypothetical protein